MPDLEVRHLTGDRFEVHVRQHTLVVDQPRSDGGEDTAPTPTELFVAGLASCVAFYARRYLKRHDLPEEGLRVDVDYQVGKRPARVAEIHLRLTLPEGLPLERRNALLAVASHCTVHNTLMEPPTVELVLDRGHENEEIA